MASVKRIGVLTSGGDAPGMNAAVRAVARTALANGIECVGIRRGWQGLITSDFVPLTRESVGHILSRGGTILYTARSDEFMTEKGRLKAVATVGIYTFLQCWNELMFANIFISKSALRTLPVGVQALSGQYTTDWGPIGAALVRATFPTLLLYIFLSKKIQDSFVAGAIKG